MKKELVVYHPYNTHPNLIRQQLIDHGFDLSKPIDRIEIPEDNKILYKQKIENPNVANYYGMNDFGLMNNLVGETPETISRPDINLESMLQAFKELTKQVKQEEFAFYTTLNKVK